MPIKSIMVPSGDGSVCHPFFFHLQMLQSAFTYMINYHLLHVMLRKIPWTTYYNFKFLMCSYAIGLLSCYTVYKCHNYHHQSKIDCSLVTTKHFTSLIGASLTK